MIDDYPISEFKAQSLKFLLQIIIKDQNPKFQKYLIFLLRYLSDNHS